MLLDKPIKKNDIITLKLLTGEEVIGQFQEDTDGQFKDLENSKYKFKKAWLQNSEFFITVFNSHESMIKEMRMR